MASGRSDDLLWENFDVILTGAAITQQRKRGAITIAPFGGRHVNPNSYNFHLHHEILVWKKSARKWEGHTILPQGFILQPKRLYLAATAEVIGSTTYVVTLLGKSSVGRLGIFLNVTADLGHIGCYSRWTLEITAVEAVRVYSGMCIGQVAFWCPTTSVNAYSGRYLGDNGPVPNRDLAIAGNAI